jgi:5-methylcytosine-specific restriction protein A
VPERARRLPRAKRKRGKRLYDRRWRKVAAAQLAAHPLCAECLRLGRVTPAEEVDHVIPHRGDLQLFWNAPLQSLCGPHHKAKTASGL